MDDQRLAECAGLWLAEGDTLSNAEITFTNNEPLLVRIFYKVLKELFPNGKFRLYVYSGGKVAKLPIRLKSVKFYTDKRANKPYYILRFASVEAVKKWKKLIKDISTDKTAWSYFLRGFFAGEGNIKTGEHHSRQLRIAQGKKSPFIEKVLRHFGLEFKYSKSERAYVISGVWNWEIFAKYRIADLHPVKKARFWSTFGEFKERHYKFHHIRNKLLYLLREPRTSEYLAKYFDRSMARIQDVLIDLKKEGVITNFRVLSVSYWTTRKDIAVISQRKLKYFKAVISGGKKTADIAAEIGVSWKAAKNRLFELNTLGLVYAKGGIWFMKKNLPEIQVKRF